MTLHPAPAPGRLAAKLTAALGRLSRPPVLALVAALAVALVGAVMACWGAFSGGR